MSGNGLARLFVAVDPPQDVALELAGWARAAAAASGRGRSGGPLRLLAAGSMHLTLLFLGGRPAAEIDPLAGALATVAGASEACEAGLGAPLWLPPRRPRALAVEVHENAGRLAALHAATAAGLGEGTGPAGRFRPHITVARTRAGERAAVPPPIPTPQLSFAVEEVVLYRSWLEPSGARYEELARFPLGAAPA